MINFTKIRMCHGALLGVPLLVGWASPAHAQQKDENPAPNADRIVVGIGAGATPTYQGAGDYRILPIPAIDIKQGWFFANLPNGIGIAPIDNAQVTIGASAVFLQGYRKRDVPQGIDKLSDGVGARLFATIRAGGFVATVGGTKSVSGGTKGLIADASVSYPVRVSSRFTLTPTVGTTWANGKYNDGYFGITAAESLASGLPRFTAGSGFKDVSGSLTASYRLTDRLTMSVTGSATSLLGVVKDSSLVVHQTQPSGFLTLSYRFR
jgi:outer membrane protein